ncbi:MAG TPA: nuclear transport factor 2 family protein [Thermomicrobiales bacterium]|nr:nuclear transport factor 2 family protein [Thermomicrobiales bacterium]
MNRRSAVIGAIAALTLRPSLASESDHIATMRVFIETVIENGETSQVDRFVTEDVAIPDFDIRGIDAFRSASDAGFANRERQYSDYTFDVMSIAESGDWVHTLIAFTGNDATGNTISDHVFYVARFTDGLISELYLS